MNKCRFCKSERLHLILDLGTAPPSNSFLTEAQLSDPEVYYPLRLFFCEDCALVQLPEYKKAMEIFNNQYVYYSSQSPSNVSHAKEYVKMVTERFDPKYVLEIGSNDGYLLQHFMTIGRSNVVVKGIDPSEGPAKAAWRKGIVTDIGFFNSAYARKEGATYDLICNINTLAHQTDVNDFVEGMKIALAPGGVITCEFPHLMRLIDECQFDTVYQEHYSYFSFMAVHKIFHRQGLEIFDVEELPTHGGSLRIYARHPTEVPEPVPNVLQMLSREYEKGMDKIEYYKGFQKRADTIKNDLVFWLHGEKSRGRKVVGYGAPAKANTSLNYCGIRSDLLAFTVDRSPHKIGKFLPGSRIPVVSEDAIRELKPAYILILAWNLKQEIVNQLSYIRDWGGKFVVAIPELEII